MRKFVDAFARGGAPCLWTTLGLLALMVLSGTSPLAAQGLIAAASTNRTAPISFASGASGENGFGRAAATLEYRFAACRGAGPAAIMISWRLTPGSLSAGSEYWLDGTSHTVSAAPSVRAIPVAGTVHSNGRQIGSVQYGEALESNRITADCNTPGLNYAAIGDIAPYADPTQPAAVAAFLNTLSFTPAAAPDPLRDSNLEQRIRADMRRAEQEAADRERQERERAAAEERQARDAERAAGVAQQSAGSSASTSGSGGATSPTISPEEAARAEEARRQEEARRAAEQVRRQMEEDQRRQKEREEAMVSAATGGAQAAIATGLGFGGYYFGISDGTYSSTFDNLQGFGMGFDADFMYLDVGVLTGVYTEGFQENYESDGYSTLDDLTVSGFFGNAGFAWMMIKDESMQLGFSGGLLYAVTPEADMYAPVMGFVGRFGGLALRLDMGLGDQSSIGGAVYFNVGR